MNITKLAIIGIVIASIWFMFSSEKYESIYFSGEVFEHVETINEDRARNVLYTLNGVSFNGSPKFIQLLQVTDPDIPEAHLEGFRKHVLKMMSLKAINGSKNRYFGIHNNTDIAYALEKNNMFIIHFIAGGISDPKNRQRSEVNRVIDALDEISISHLN